MAKVAHLLLFDPLSPGVLLSGSCWPTPFTSPRALAKRNAVAGELSWAELVDDRLSTA